MEEVDFEKTFDVIMSVTHGLCYTRKLFSQIMLYLHMAKVDCQCQTLKV